MAFAAAAIRTAITEVVEAAGPFSYGAFEGQTGEALMSRLRQTSTAEHWFDVRVSPARNSTASNVASGNGRRLMAFDVAITVWTGLATETQETARDTVLDAVGADCAAACRALSRPHSISETSGGTSTFVIGGKVAGPGGRGTPSWRIVSENWTTRQLRHEITGSITVRSVGTPQSILGADLHTWLIARQREVTRDGDDVITWRNLGGSGDPTQATEALRPTYDADGFSTAPAVVSDGTQGLVGTLTTTLAAGSRPYIWAVAQADAVASTTIRRVLTINNNAASPGFRFVGIGVGETNFETRLWTTDGGPVVDERIVGPAFDTDPHLFEFGALESTTDKFVVDGAGFDGSTSLAIDSEYTTLSVFALFSTQTGLQTPMDGSIAEIVIASSLPTAAQITAMRDYFRSRPLGLTIA